MKLNEHQKLLIQESILEKILRWYIDNQKWKAKKMFENDPELKKITREIFAQMEKTSKKIDDYCKKYGCIEPSKHTKMLPKSVKDL
jgi:isocitrate lyase